MKRVLVLLTIMFSLCGCSSAKDTVVFSNVKTIELGEEFDSCSLVESINNEIITSSMVKNNSIYLSNNRMTCSSVDTSVLGEHKVLFNIDKQLFEDVIEVVDTKSPEIEIEDVKTKVDEEVDLLEKAKISDNGEVVETAIQGDYDFSKAGTYSLKLVAKDASGNVGEKEFTLTVEKEESKNESSKPSSNSSNNANSNNNTHPNNGGTSGSNTSNTTTPSESNNNQGSTSQEETPKQNDSSENGGNTTPACLGGSMHIEAEEINDEVTAIVRNFAETNNCSSASINSDGTQYGWNITCSCN